MMSKENKKNYIEEMKKVFSSIYHISDWLVNTLLDNLRRSLELKTDIHKTQIYSVMSKNVKTINETALANKAIEIMQKNQIYVLIVINNQKEPVGVIRMHDLMQSGLV